MVGGTGGSRARPGDLKRVGVATAAATAAYMLLLGVAEQAGLPPGYGFIVTGVLLVSLLVLAGISQATAHAQVWTAGGRREESLTMGMATAAVLLALVFQFALPGAFFSGSAGAAAWIAGPLAGVALGSVLVVPYLRRSGEMSVADCLRRRFGGRAAALAVSVLASSIAFLAAWSQIQAAGALAPLFFPVSRPAAAAVAAALVFLVVAPGGLGGVVRVGSLVFAFAATAILGPAVWLSALAAGLPVPQLVYGATALDEIAAIEAQSRALGLRELAETVTLSLPSGSGVAAAAAMAAFLALAFAALPPMLVAWGAGKGVRAARAGGGWALVCAGLVLGAAPAVAAFAKLAMYNGIFGLTAAEIEGGASWLLQWSRFASPLDPQSPAATLCGQAVISAEAAVAACGGDPDYALSPADLAVASDTVGLALADIALLPTVFAMTAGAAAIALCIAASAAAMLALSNELAAGMAGARHPSPNLTRLFAHRAFVSIAVVGAGVLAYRGSAPPLEPALHALALAAGLLLPALTAAIYSDRLRGGVLASAVSAGAAAYAAWHALAGAGPDFAAGSGDEIALRLPGLENLPGQFHAAAAAFAVAATIAVVLSFFIRPKPDADRLEALRAPDRRPAD